MRGSFCRPFGTGWFVCLDPSAEADGQILPSLRDCVCRGRALPEPRAADLPQSSTQPSAQLRNTARGQYVLCPETVPNTDGVNGHAEARSGREAPTGRGARIRQSCRGSCQKALMPRHGIRRAGVAGRDAEGACREAVPGAVEKYLASLAIYGALRADLDPRYPGSRIALTIPYTPSESVGFFGLASY